MIQLSEKLIKICRFGSGGVQFQARSDNTVLLLQYSWVATNQKASELIPGSFSPHVLGQDAKP